MEHPVMIPNFIQPSDVKGGRRTKPTYKIRTKQHSNKLYYKYASKIRASFDRQTDREAWGIQDQ